MQFRAEFFNLFNPAQFNNPDGNIKAHSAMCSAPAIRSLGNSRST
jgi:hypothetical protein